MSQYRVNILRKLVVDPLCRFQEICSIKRSLFSSKEYTCSALALFRQIVQSRYSSFLIPSISFKKICMTVLSYLISTAQNYGAESVICFPIATIRLKIICKILLGTSL